MPNDCGGLLLRDKARLNFDIVPRWRPPPDVGPRQMSSSPADGENIFQPRWEDGERVFCRGWRDGGEGPREAVLTVLLAAQPSPPTHPPLLPPAIALNA